MDDDTQFTFKKNANVHVGIGGEKTSPLYEFRVEQQVTIPDPFVRPGEQALDKPFTISVLDVYVSNEGALTPYDSVVTVRPADPEDEQELIIRNGQEGRHVKYRGGGKEYLFSEKQIQPSEGLKIDYQFLEEGKSLIGKHGADKYLAVQQTYTEHFQAMMEAVREPVEALGDVLDQEKSKINFKKHEETKGTIGLHFATKTGLGAAHHRAIEGRGTVPLQRN